MPLKELRDLQYLTVVLCFRIISMMMASVGTSGAQSACCRTTKDPNSHSYLCAFINSNDYYIDPLFPSLLKSVLQAVKTHYIVKWEHFHQSYL